MDGSTPELEAPPIPLPDGDAGARLDASWEAQKGVEFLLLDRLASDRPHLTRDLPFYRRSVLAGADAARAAAFVAAHNERLLARLRAEGVPVWAPARRRLSCDEALAELSRASVAPALFEPTRAERILLRADAGRWGDGAPVRLGRDEERGLVIVGGRVDRFRAAVHLLDVRERRWMCAYLVIGYMFPEEDVEWDGRG